MSAQFIIEHLWQSTLFGVACGVMIFCLRKGSTGSRHFIAWAAILKFLIPLQALLWVGDFLPALKPVKEDGNANLLGMLSAPPGIKIDTSIPDFSASTAVVESGTFHVNWLVVLSVLWVVVSLVLVVNWVRLYVIAMRLKRRECVPAGSEWIEMVAMLWTESNRQPPELLVSVGSTFQAGVFGIFRQSIIIPQNLAEALSSREREQFLRHELAHAASRDTLWLFVQQRIRDLFWFHPLVWWMDNQISLLREILRDEVVITKTNNKKIYLNCLMKASMIEQPGRCGTSVGLKDSSFGKRALAIAHFKKSALRDWISNTIGAATIVACMGLLVLSVANSQAEESASTENAEAFFATRRAELEKMKSEGESVDLEMTLLEAEVAEHKAKQAGPPQEMTELEKVFIKEIVAMLESESKEEVLDLLLSRLDENSSAPLYFIAANLFIETGNIEKGIDFYRVALDRNPDSNLRLRASRNLGIILLKAEKWNEETHVFEEYLGDSTQSLSGRMEEVAHFLEEAMYLGASDATTYGLLGLAYVNSGKPTAAEYYYEKAIELAPDVGDWKLGLAKSLKLQEKNEELIPLMREIIEIEENRKEEN